MQLATPLAQPVARVLCQSLHVRPRRAHAERKGLPPFVEGPVLDLDGEKPLLHVAETGLVEEPLEVALARAGEVRLVGDARVELARGVPEARERASAARVIPHARRDDAAATGHASHLCDSGRRIGHEVDDELRQRRVERAVVERQALRLRAPDVDAGVALARSLDEPGGRVDGCDRVRAESPHELARQGSRAAADIEQTLRLSDGSEVREPRRQRRRVPAHEPVVGLRTGGEAHALRKPGCAPFVKRLK